MNGNTLFLDEIARIFGEDYQNETEGVHYNTKPKEIYSIYINKSGMSCYLGHRESVRERGELKNSRSTKKRKLYASVPLFHMRERDCVKKWWYHKKEEEMIRGDSVNHLGKVVNILYDFRQDLENKV